MRTKRIFFVGCLTICSLYIGYLVVYQTDFDLLWHFSRRQSFNTSTVTSIGLDPRIVTTSNINTTTFDRSSSGSHVNNATNSASHAITTPKVSKAITTPKVSNAITTPKVSNAIITPKVRIAITTPKVSNAITTPKVSNTITTPKIKTEAEIKQEVVEAINLTARNTEITLVTMYLSLGKLHKGIGRTFFTKNTYMSWMESWKFITNPVIAYFEDDQMLKLFSEARSHLPPSRSIIKKVNRTDLSSYKNYLEPIRQIFQQKGYPKHPPNTVVPEYSCAMHAKYDVVEMAMNQEQINTKYLAWMDIGLLRNERNAKGPISLHVTSSFDESRISYTLVSANNKTIFSLKPMDMVRQNVVWVAGGYFVATQELMRQQIQAYRGALKELVDLKAINTDQQVLGALYSGALQQKPLVNVQTHFCRARSYGLLLWDARYFCYTYRCKEAGAIILKTEKEKRRKGS